MEKINFARMGFDTKAIHARKEPDEAYGYLATPIYQTSTFCFKPVGKHYLDNAVVLEFHGLKQLKNHMLSWTIH